MDKNYLVRLISIRADLTKSCGLKAGQIRVIRGEFDNPLWLIRYGKSRVDWTCTELGNFEVLRELPYSYNFFADKK
jgi:hypothetical protein